MLVTATDPEAKVMDRKIVEQNSQCAICHVGFTDYGDIVPDHKNVT
ncbi:MAG TPA: hypothetical protein VK129_04685 [Terriglobales bacterium]|nr:hypothetical protein [Terriglobales bacterium]